MVIPKTPVAWLVVATAVVAPRELVLALTGWSPGGRLMGVRLVSAATGGAPRTRLFIHADLLCVTMARVRFEILTTSGIFAGEL